MLSAVRYEITKHHLTGFMNGAVTKEISAVEMPLGDYTNCVTGAQYKIIECRLAVDYLGRTVTA